MSKEIIEFPKDVCEVCKKRPVKWLCDRVIGEHRYVGHPPKINGIIDGSIPISRLITCDIKLCDKCVTHIDGMDICPSCLKKIKEA